MKATVILLAVLLCCGFVFADQLNVKGDISEKVDTTVGKDLVIILPSNRTTGYEWKLAKPVNGKFVAYKDTKYLRDSHELIGSGGKEIWRFTTLKPGKTRIVFKYVQAWAKATFMARKANILVMIRE